MQNYSHGHQQVFRHFIFSVLIISSALGGIGCNKDTAPVTMEKEPPTTTVVTGSMAATIGGHSWVATGSSKLAGVTAVRKRADGHVILDGFRNAGDTTEVIHFEIRNAAVGSYPLEPGFGSVQSATFTRKIAQSEAVMSTYFIAEKDAGNFTIATIDTLKHTISGSFAFSAHDNLAHPIQIASGTYSDVQYLEE